MRTIGYGTGKGWQQAQCDSAQADTGLVGKTVNRICQAEVRVEAKSFRTRIN
nr:hypothetical protein [Spirosoma pollinicola]